MAVREKEKIELDILEESILDFWRKNKKRRIIKGLHTEVVIEPRVFMRGELNPEIAAILSEQILLRLLQDPQEAKRVKISEEVIIITDENGNPVVEIRDPKIISAFLNK